MGTSGTCRHDDTRRPCPHGRDCRWVQRSRLRGRKNEPALGATRPDRGASDGSNSGRSEHRIRQSGPTSCDSDPGSTSRHTRANRRSHRRSPLNTAPRNPEHHPEWFRCTLRHGEPAGRPLVWSSDHVRGKSGLHRAGCWVTPRRRKPTESATENRPPTLVLEPAGKGETVV